LPGTGSLGPGIGIRIETTLDQSQIDKVFRKTALLRRIPHERMYLSERANHLAKVSLAAV